MILARMNLTSRPANTRPILTNNNKQILANKTHTSIGLNYLNVSQTLPVRANLILALHNQNAAISQYSFRLQPRSQIKIQNSLMIFAPRLIATPVIPVMTLKPRRSTISRTPRTVHVRRIKNNAINLTINIRKISAIRPRQKVCRLNNIRRRRNMTPENTLPIRHIRNNTPTLHIKIQNLRKNNLIAFARGTQNQICCRLPVSYTTLGPGCDIIRNILTLFLQAHANAPLLKPS